ncbi:MAG: phosphodiesterase [Azoarcus sp.]|jgi:3',5'-cyclic AMP phosphodiesterase CpdA|nr:phosphodiesterase [Azoarcus sp.]
MRIAQLSDLHFCEAPDFLGGRVRPDVALDAALAAINTLAPKPDLLLITGDLAESGSIAEYTALRVRFDRFALPVLAVPGNHDDATIMRETLSPYVPAREPEHCAYVVDAHPLTLIGLDTTWPGHIPGRLDAAQLDWLERVLSEHATGPILIGMHHPPIVTGLPGMDAHRLFDGAEAFADLLKRYGQSIAGILCGHVHRSIHGSFAGVPTCVCPAPVHQIAFDLRNDAPLAYCLEPPQYALHQWLPEQGIVSHCVCVNSFPGPFLF